MQTRIAVIGIIVENKDSVESVNGLLHQYGQYIMGIAPLQGRGLEGQKNKTVSSA